MVVAVIRRAVAHDGKLVGSFAEDHVNRFVAGKAGRLQHEAALRVSFGVGQERVFTPVFLPEHLHRPVGEGLAGDAVGEKVGNRGIVAVRIHEIAHPRDLKHGVF